MHPQRVLIPSGARCERRGPRPLTAAHRPPIVAAEALFVARALLFGAGAHQGGRYLTLTTCDPLYGRTNRLIVFTELAGWTPVTAPAPGAVPVSAEGLGS